LAAASAMQVSDYPRAMLYLAKIDEATLDDPAILADAAVNLINKNRTADAIQILDRVIAHFPAAPDPYYYRGFARQGFRIAAIVDDDPQKVGRAVNGLTIQALAELPRVVKAHAIQIGVVAVPAEAAQGVADRLVAAGVRAILNFAPSRVKVPKDVRLQNVDLSIELENLSFHLGQAPR